MPDAEGKIFVNYRRDDDPGSTGRLFDRLETHFAPGQLFLDVDSIPPGLDFVKFLDQKVSECDVLLAVIGRDWLDAIDETGARRLDNPDDFVRIEIESALKRGIRVIPVLMGRAEMPAEDQLPASLKPFARRNAFRLKHDRFKADCDGLIKAIERGLETAKRQREEAKERERSLRAALPADQVAKANELANWASIKRSRNERDFEDHVARFSGGATERMARAKLEALSWTTGFGPEIIAAIVLPFQVAMAMMSASVSQSQDRLELFPDPVSKGVIAGIPIVLGVTLTVAWLRHGRRHRSELINYWLALVFATSPLALLVESSRIVWGSIICLVAVIGTGGLVLAGQRKTPSGAEIGTYWLGCSFALLICASAAFESMDWNWLSVTYPGTGATTGVAVAFAITLGSAILLAYLRWPILAPELSTYWLGCILVLAVLLGSWAYANQWTLPLPFVTWQREAHFGAGALVALAIGLVSAFVLAYPRRMTLSAAELRRYWVGCTLVALLAWLSIYWSVGGVVAFGIASAAGLALYLWWRRNRRDDAPQAAPA